eukprot:CAMPEP_0194492722 /NCGR_PEP_ID=MMETSP0253-20130528/11180_1 /TAXON_ID=2966 /ORGANISM="Noctiluca scintillans" /LENGTH=41 /DNA_ID= /DNA_START= /DNA_END= /DNA_ORIENTATION=
MTWLTWSKKTHAQSDPRNRACASAKFPPGNCMVSGILDMSV